MLKKIKYALGVSTSRPVFVIGTGRSGIHWLGYSLGNHPEVRATIEVNPMFELSTSMAMNVTLEAQLFEKLVQALSAQISEKELLLNEIVNSKAWKVALLFRRVRTLLVPPNSRRARILRRGVNIIIFPFKEIRRNQKIKDDLDLIKPSGLFEAAFQNNSLQKDGNHK